MADKMVTTKKDHECIGCEVVIPKGSRIFTTTRRVVLNEKSGVERVCVRLCRACLCVYNDNPVLRVKAIPLWAGIMTGKEYASELEAAKKLVATFDAKQDES